MKIKDLNLFKEIKKQELLDALKYEASEVHIKDIMDFYVHLVADGKYVQKYYLKDYIDAYVTGFILRIKEIKDNKNHYEGLINLDEFKKALKLLNEQEKTVKKVTGESRLFKIYKIISLYTTFILNEPIHIVGTRFPGGFKVKYENKEYYCPVKESQKDNPNAVCAFCISKQDESI